MMMVFGFIMILVAYLVTSSKANRVEIGGVLGVFVMVASAIVPLDLIQALATASSNYPYVSNVYSNVYYVWAQVSFPVVLFVGFPLGLLGSLGAIRNSQVGEVPSTATH
jgi:thiosulfate reductase cytochrome b subunit